MSPECHRPQRSPRLCGGPERGARIRRHFGVTAVGIICACALSSGDFVSRNFSPGYPSTHAPWFIGMRVSPPWCLSHWGPGLPWLGGGDPVHWSRIPGLHTLHAGSRPPPVLTSRNACRHCPVCPEGSSSFGGEAPTPLDVRVW